MSEMTGFVQSTVQNTSSNRLTSEVNESSPLLQYDASKFPRIIEVELIPEESVVLKEEKFPTAQLCVIAFVRIVEPITFTSILPYIYAQTVYLLSGNGSLRDGSSVALYSALLISSFAFTETLTSHIWGRLSDIYGRKPVIIIGLTGSAISLILYGFSTNIALAMTARIFGGLLNGNLGVLQTAVAELTGAREDWRAKGQLVIPFVWCLGSIIGPAIGGGFSPNVPGEDMMHAHDFQVTGLWAKYPYMLPNIICALIAVLGMAVGWLFLEETNQQIRNSKQEPDYGLVIGEYLLDGPKKFMSRLMKRYNHTHRRPVTNLQTAVHKPLKGASGDSLGISDIENCHENTALATANPSSSTSMYRSLSAIDSCISLPSQLKDTSPPKSVYTPRFYLLMTTFFIIYYHSTAFEHLLAIFLQSPLPPLFPMPQGQLPLGEGFGFTTQVMGLLFLAQGVFQMCIQFVVFPFLNKRFSKMGIYLTTLAIYPVFYFLMPLLVLLPQGSVAFWICLSMLLIVKIILEITSYPALFLVLYDFAADSPDGMGSVYGLSAAFAGAAKGMGPVLTGALWKAGMSWGGVGLAWWSLSALSIVGMGITVYLKVTGKGNGRNAKEEE